MIRNILLVLMILMTVASSTAQTINVHNGSVASDKDYWSSLPLFTAYKGDKIKFTAEVEHKRKDVQLYVLQYPGELIVYANDAMESDNYEFTVPSNAIYGFWYRGAGENISLKVDRIHGPNAKETPLKWKMVADMDTIHNSGFRDVVIGKRIKYQPRVQRVKVREIETSEILSNTSYGLTPGGKMVYPLEVPNSDNDNYRKKEIIGLSVTLTAGNSTYEALKGVVAKGLTAAASKAANSAAKAGAKKIIKQNPASNYDFVDNVFEYKDKLETTQELLELGVEANDALSENSTQESNGERLARGEDVQAYVFQDDGFQAVNINKAKKEEGEESSEGELSISGLTGYDIPSIEDLADKAAGVITPKIVDKVTLELIDASAGGDTVFTKTDGFITKEIPLDGSEYKVYLLALTNPRQLKDAKNLTTALIHGNVIVEARFRLTDYADMVYFDRVEEPVTTRRFQKNSKTEFRRKLVIDGQEKPWEKELGGNLDPLPPSVMVIPN
ncbi:hypothetical protein [Marinilabilia sp.]